MAQQLTATQAYELAKKNRKEVDISKVLAVIEKAVAVGDFSTTYDDNLDLKQQEKLRSLGYSVKSFSGGYNESYYTISWEPISYSGSWMDR